MVRDHVGAGCVQRAASGGCGVKSDKSHTGHDAGSAVRVAESVGVTEPVRDTAPARDQQSTEAVQVGHPQAVDFAVVRPK